MGSHFFKSQPGSIKPNGLNMEARAIGAPSYAGRQAGSKSAKDLGMAAGIYKAGGLKPTAKTAAVSAPGPKRT